MRGHRAVSDIVKVAGLVLLFFAASGVAFPAGSAAQTPATALLNQARTQLDELNPDSAGKLLLRVLDPRAGVSTQERVRAFVLYGIAQLSAGRRDAARQAFREGLALDPAQRVDSLSDLHSDLLTVFNAERGMDSEVPRLPRSVLEIRGLPDSARLAVDGVVWTTRRREVPPGLRRIEVTAPGYAPYRDSIVVDTGAALIGDVVLRPQEPGEAAAAEPAHAAVRTPRGVLEIRGLPDSARLSVDGVVWPVRRRQVSAGLRRIDVTAPGYATYRDSVLVDSGAVVIRQVPMARVGAPGVQALDGGEPRVTLPPSPVQEGRPPCDAGQPVPGLAPALRGEPQKAEPLIEVRGLPGEARLFVDGVAWTGRRGSVGAGVHRVEVQGLASGPYRDSVVVASGVAVVLDLAPNRDGTPPPRIAAAAGTRPPGPGSLCGVLEVRGLSNGARLVVDGRLWAMSRGNVAAGTRRVEVRAPGYLPHREWVTVPGATLMIRRLTLLPARLTIRVRSAGTLAAGQYHTCGLDAAGAAFCWGDNTAGQLGTGSGRVASSHMPIAVLNAPRLIEVRAGAGHTCGVTGSATVVCWGQGWFGQTGQSTTMYLTEPARLPIAASLTSVAAGVTHTCALATDGAVYCWGNNSVGQLGSQAPSDATFRPLRVALVTGIAAIDAGHDHTCAVAVNGRLYCWGSNEHGELGRGALSRAGMPEPVTPDSDFAMVSAGGGHTCAVATNGTAYCWGANSYGQLGDGSADDAATPSFVSGGLTFAMVSAGADHTCGVTVSGVAYCWGNNQQGQLGTGSRDNSTIPVAVAGGRRFAFVVAGHTHSCGVTVDGTLYCWGANSDGQLGIGFTPGTRVPMAVSDRSVGARSWSVP